MKPYNPLQFWEERGECYHEKLDDEDFQRVTAEHREVVNGMLGEVPIKRFIEVGCGSGRLLDLYQRFPVVVGIDISSSMLRYASSIGRDIPLEQLNLLRGSATRLPFQSGAFDCALTSEVLLHIPPRDILLALREISRISHFAVLLEFYSSDDEDPQTLKEKRKELASWNFLHDYPKLFEHAGLRVLRRVELRTLSQTCFLVTDASSH